MKGVTGYMGGGSQDGRGHNGVLERCEDHCEHGRPQQNRNSHWRTKGSLRGQGEGSLVKEAERPLRREPWLSGSLGLRLGALGMWGLHHPSTHWLGLAPEASRNFAAELWPNSTKRKSPVCPAECSPSTWITEGQQGLGLSQSSWGLPGNTVANSLHL